MIQGVRVGLNCRRFFSSGLAKDIQYGGAAPGTSSSGGRLPIERLRSNHPQRCFGGILPLTRLVVHDCTHSDVKRKQCSLKERKRLLYGLRGAIRGQAQHSLDASAGQTQILEAALFGFPLPPLEQGCFFVSSLTLSLDLQQQILVLD